MDGIVDPAAKGIFIDSDDHFRLLELFTHPMVPPATADPEIPIYFYRANYHIRRFPCIGQGSARSVISRIRFQLHPIDCSHCPNRMLLAGFSLHRRRTHRIEGFDFYQAGQKNPFIFYTPSGSDRYQTACGCFLPGSMDAGPEIF